MPPKSRKDDAQERPPEGDHERLLTITVSGVLEPRDGLASRDASSASRPPAVSQPVSRATPRAPAGTAAAAPAGDGGSPPFVSRLRTPHFTLRIPGEGTAAAEELIRCEPLPSSEQEFSQQLLMRKLTLDPQVITRFLAGEFVLTALTVNEPKGAASAPDSAPGAGAVGGKGAPKHKGAGKAGGGGGGAKGGAADGSTTARSDISEADVSTVLAHRFSLANVLTSATCDVMELANVEAEPEPAEVPPSSALTASFPADSLAERTTKKLAAKSRVALRHIPGFQKLVLTIQVNEPLLAPENIAKYRPVVIEVTKATSLPPATPLDLRHNGCSSSSLAATVNDGRLSRNYSGVFVKYKFLGRAVQTEKVPHADVVSFNHKAVFFLGAGPALKWAQELFFEPIRFELHDREVRSEDKNDSAGEAFGVAPVPLRLALDGETRFVSTTQVISGRHASLDAPVPSAAVTTPSQCADYLSHSTALQTKVTFLHQFPTISFVPRPTQAPEAPASPATAGVVGLQSKPPSRGSAGGRSRPPSAAGRAATVAAARPPSSPLAAATAPVPAAEAPTVRSAALEAAAPKCHLTRAVIVAPYQTAETRAFLSSLMGTLVQFARARGDEDDVMEAAVLREALAAQAAAAHAAAQAAAEAAAVAAGSKKGGPKDKAALAPPEVDPSVVSNTTVSARPNVLELVATDCVSGFEIMDGQHRIIVLEGPFLMIHKLVSVVLDVTGGNPAAASVHFNTTLAFPARWYHRWPPLTIPLVMPTSQGDASATNDQTGPVALSDPVKESKRAAGKAPATAQASALAAAPVPAAQATAAARDGVEGEEERDDEWEHAAAELDGGGVGGRIRRIRLASPLDHIRDKQKNYLHRNLTPECFHALRKLCALRQCTSVLSALNHDYFPTAAELIALERVAGQTLEVEDVCGCDRFFSFSETNVDAVVAEAIRERASPKRVMRDDSVDLRNLERFVGRVLSFTAIPATAAQVKGYPSLSQIFHRYRHRAYMYVPSINHCVVCAFPTAPPHQLLRYCVTAQVIACDDSTLLFAMSVESLAKHGTDSYNRSFVAKKRRELTRAPPSECHRIRDRQKRQYMATHTMSGAPAYRDTSSDDDEGFVDAPPDSALEIGERQLGAHGQSAIAHENVEVMENHVVRNKLLASSRRGVTSSPMTGTQTEGAMTAKQLQECERLFEEANARIRRQEAKHSIPAFTPPVPFSTILHKSAVEDRQRNIVLSASRVDDLKQPWLPPEVAQKSAKPGANPIRVHGARGILDDPQRSRSIFQSESAAKLVAMEEADRRREVEQWRSKVVVDDPSFRVSCKTQRDRCSNQIDKLKGLLEGEPKKVSMKRSYAPPAPTSIREVEKMESAKFVAENEVKHPEIRQFYYAPANKQLHPKGGPIQAVERASPLYSYSPVEFKK